MFGGIKRVSNDMQFGVCYPTHTRYVRRSFQPLSESHFVLTTYAIQAHTSLVAYRIMSKNSLLPFAIGLAHLSGNTHNI